MEEKDFPVTSQGLKLCSGVKVGPLDDAAAVAEL